MELIRTVIAVPARIESSRLPNKVLADIEGEVMIKRVLKQCLKSQLIDEVFLCTDNNSIAKEALELNVKVLKTRGKFSSGSERIASVIDKFTSTSIPLENTLIINVQGDQPFLDPKIIDNLSELFRSSKIKPEVITPIYPMSGNNIKNPNVVKTIIDTKGRVLYFSRSPIPYLRGIQENMWSTHFNYWGHVGIYGFRGDILKKWNTLPESKLERAEKLEQLRLLEAGIEILTFRVDEESLSVDTLDQLNMARKIAKNYK
jgi:3-deoxy-manno-octulosonate cytidylyltransferase (CMP-KDO synthetase)